MSVSSGDSTARWCSWFNRAWLSRVSLRCGDSLAKWAVRCNRSGGSRVSLSPAVSEARRSLRLALTRANRRSLASAVSEARRLLVWSRSVASRCSLASAVSEARRLLVRSRSVANRLSLSGCAEVSDAQKKNEDFSHRLKQTGRTRQESVRNCYGSACCVKLERFTADTKIRASWTTRLARSRSPISNAWVFFGFSYFLHKVYDHAIP